VKVPIKLRVATLAVGTLLVSVGAGSLLGIATADPNASPSVDPPRPAWVDEKTGELIPEKFPAEGIPLLNGKGETVGRYTLDDYTSEAPGRASVKREVEITEDGGTVERVAIP
jgi:hypothetical protein